MLRSIFFAIGVFAVGMPGAASQDDDWLDKQKTFLDKSEEGPVYVGGEACARNGGAGAVELLLDLLGLQTRRGLPAPHYRDIAWDSLVMVKAPEGRAVVADYLADSDEEMVREWCADLLGLYRDEEYGDALIKALRDREDGVKRAAARALGRLKYKPAVAGLKKLVKSRDVRTRGNAIGSLALIDPETFGELLEKHLEDKDPSVRCVLLSLVPKVLEDRCEELSVEALQDEDWRPVLQAVRNLGKIKTKTTVDALVLATTAERSCISLEAMAMLNRLTAQKFTRNDQWQNWWQDHRATFEFPRKSGSRREDKNGTTATYNGIRIDSDNAAFLMDVSLWMDKELVERQERRIDVAQFELAEAFKSLTAPFNFNIFLYAEDIEPLSKKGPMKFTKATTKKALKFVDQASAYGAKDIWNALFQTITDGRYDAIYLLSSGEPDVGWVVHPKHLNYHLAELIRYHPVKVHTIGYTDKRGYQSQLDAIAKTTGGESRHVE